MNIQESEAIDRAFKFAQLERNESQYFISKENSHAIFKGNGIPHWTIFFFLKGQRGDAIAMDPDHIVVNVNAVNGTTEWVPTV